MTDKIIPQLDNVFTERMEKAAIIAYERIRGEPINVEGFFQTLKQAKGEMSDLYNKIIALKQEGLL